MAESGLVKSDSIGFACPVRPDELKGFISRLGEWMESMPVGKFSMDWDGVSAHVKISVLER